MSEAIREIRGGYADEITYLLIVHGLLDDESAENFKRFVRGW